MARLPPSPDNTATHARIVALLGESGHALVALDQALEQNPESPVLLRTKGQLLYEQKDYPGAAQHGLMAWEKSGHADRSAWTLYQMSKDRDAPSGAAPNAPPAQGTATVSDDGPSKPFKLAAKGRARSGEVPTLLNTKAPNEPAPRHSPLLPILLVTGTGLTALGAYKVSQSQSTGKSEDGINPEPKVAAAQARRNYVNSAVLIGTPILVFGLVSGGPAVWARVAPPAIALLRTGTASVQKLATSQAGAFFPEEQVATQRVETMRKLPWNSWAEYPKVLANGREYARIGNRLYTEHAVQRMLPSSLASGNVANGGRSMSPTFAEEVILRGTQTTDMREGTLRTFHRLGTVEVITEQGGEIVVTVNPFKFK